MLMASTVLFSGCATQGKPPPSISLDEPVQAQALPVVPKPVEVVSVPEPWPLPGQLMPVPGTADAKASPEPTDEKLRVSRANAEARIAPTREGYVNAIQVWPFTDGALYQVYAAVGRVTVVALQPGEELLIRRELFMRPHRRHACRQSTSGPALACSPTSSCVLSPPRAAWPWFAPEPCCQSHASNRH